jgi:hypothetical protein
MMVIVNVHSSKVKLKTNTQKCSIFRRPITATRSSTASKTESAIVKYILILVKPELRVRRQYLWRLNNLELFLILAMSLTDRWLEKKKTAKVAQDRLPC